MNVTIMRKRLIMGRSLWLYLSLSIILVLLVFFLMLLLPQNVNAASISYEEWSLDSPHNYGNNYNQQWRISRTGATKIQVYFEKIDTENVNDFVYIKDTNGNTYNTYSGYRIGAASAWVPGATVVIELDTDNTITDWGFHLSEIAIEYPAIQSPHNYPNNYDHSWFVKSPGATRIQVKFTKIDVELNYDKIRIYNRFGTLKWTYTGDSNNQPVYSPYISQPPLRIRLTSDASVTRYGFAVECWYSLIDDDDGVWEITVLGVEDYKEQNNLDNDDAYVMLDLYELAGWKLNHKDFDAAVDRGDFYNEGDEGDLIFFTGHGSKSPKGRACLDGYNAWWKYARKDRYFDHDDADLNNMGLDDYEWTIFACCWILGDKKGHVDEFLHDGGHACYGYDGLSWEHKWVWQNGQWVLTRQDEVIVADTFDYMKRGFQMEHSWSNANHDNDQHHVIMIAHKTTDDDHLWGCGYVAPDDTSNNNIVRIDHN